MKYVITVFITAVVVFLGATIYYRGLPTFNTPESASTVSEVSEPTPTPAPTEVPVSEDELAASIKDALLEKYGSESADMNVKVSKIEGDYAKGTVTEEGGGAMWFAAVKNGFWTLVWDGNGVIVCEDISAFPEFPADLIPECWDEDAEKIITR